MKLIVTKYGLGLKYFSSTFYATEEGIQVGVYEKLFEIGLVEGLGIFFLLFVSLALITFCIIREVWKDNKEREKVHLQIIQDLSETVGEVRGVKACFTELRTQVLRNHDDFMNHMSREHTDIKGMIGRILDNLREGRM